MVIKQKCELKGGFLSGICRNTDGKESIIISIIQKIKEVKQFAQIYIISRARIKPRSVWLQSPCS